MPKNIKTNYEIKKSRIQRRLFQGMLDCGGALCLLTSAALLCLSLIYVYSYVLSMPYFQIKEISIRGLNELTEKDILSLASVRRNESILAVNLDEVSRKILVNPWVKKSFAGRELPNRLVLEIQERKAAALIKNAGDFYLIDTEGVVFKKIGKGDEADLPIITGASWRDKTPSKLLPGALSLTRIMAGSVAYAQLGTISEININEMFGLALLTDAGFYIKLGMENYENKLRQAVIIVEDLEKRGLKGGYLAIDLSDLAKVTVQRKNSVGRNQDAAKNKKYKT